MKKIMFLAMLVISANLFAQSAHKIMGTVIDEQSKAPLPGANVTVLIVKDSSIITGAATDDKGKFALDGIKEKNVRLKISMIGYQTTSMDINLDKGSIDIGRIAVKQSVYELGEAVVQAQKPMIEYTVDKQVVNIERTPEAGGSVTDALRSSGAVNVDPTTNKISIRGGADTKIWIDGKPAQMTEDMLAQLPASSIERVEIMTNPSAKDDPEGDSGIINIITKKGGLGTFSGSASLSTSTRKWNNGSLVLNYKVNKLTLFGNISGYFGTHEGGSVGNGTNYLSEYKHYTTNNASNDFDGQFYNGKLGFDYDFDTMNVLSVSGALSNNDYDWVSNGYNDYYTAQHVHNDSSYNTVTDGDNLRHEYSVSAFYKKKFNMKGHEITADAYYATMEYNNGNDYDAAYDYNHNFPERQQNQTNTDNNTFIYKTDYVNPASFGKVEAGYNFTFRDRTNDYASLNYDYGQAGWIDNYNLSNVFNYKESIHALYASYSNSLGKFDYKGGIRLEQAYNEGDQKTTNSKFQTDYLSWYPSATLSYKVWNNFPLSFNFARRVRRPQLEMINPFVRRNSPFSTSVGNPEIGPTYIYVYELSLERMLKFYHTSAKGSPTQATISNPDGTSTTTTVNMDWGKSYGVETSLAYMSGDPRMPFTLPKWISMININAQYYKYEGKGRYGVENLGSKSDNWNLNGSLNMSLWYDVSSNIYVYYRPKNNDTRNRNNSQLFLYMGFSKAFFDRKLQVRINLMDLLNTSKEWVNEEFADTYYSYNKWTSSIGRSVGISFTYSFNNYRPKQERNIGDDRDAGGSGMPGGQGGM